MFAVKKSITQSYGIGLLVLW